MISQIASKHCTKMQIINETNSKYDQALIECEFQFTAWPDTTATPPKCPEGFQTTIQLWSCNHTTATLL